LRIGLIQVRRPESLSKNKFWMWSAKMEELYLPLNPLPKGKGIWGEGGKNNDHQRI
jgi:hypothetical protein